MRRKDLGRLHLVLDLDLLHHQVHGLTGNGLVPLRLHEGVGIQRRIAELLAAALRVLHQRRAHPEGPRLPGLLLIDDELIRKQVLPTEPEKVRHPEPEEATGINQQGVPNHPVVVHLLDEHHRLIPVHRVGRLMRFRHHCHFVIIVMF